MCVLCVAHRVVPGCPTFVLTNREESIDRPSRPPATFAAADGRAGWFGATDASAGGTWFGINALRMMAAVTNRKKNDTPPDSRSRGLLCRDALGQTSAQAAVDWVMRELKERAYAGFNMVLADSQSVWVIEAIDSIAATALGSGIHVVSNGPLNAVDDRRAQYVRRLVERLDPARQSPASLIQPAKEICRLHLDGDHPAVCLHADRWETVGSTIAAVSDDPLAAQYHYAAGPPCCTPYVDYSRGFRELLRGPSAARVDRR